MKFAFGKLHPARRWRTGSETAASVPPKAGEEKFYHQGEEGEEVKEVKEKTFSTFSPWRLKKSFGYVYRRQWDEEGYGEGFVGGGAAAVRDGGVCPGRGGL
jgi:hypothetical protein